MIHDGDVFITKLERGFFGAFRVLKTNGHFDFSKHEFYLIAVTSYIDTKKPEISDKRLREILCEKRFLFGGKPNINIYSGQVIDKQFEYLGNIPLSKEEAKLKIRIGDGEHIEYGGGFPLVGAVQNDFGKEAFLEWRWEHEREIWLTEQENELQKQKVITSNKKSLKNKYVMQAYRFQDKKSDKFWRIEFSGNTFAVNYGKTGTTGKYQVKEFGTEEDCKKEANKLINSKLKKGYHSYNEFDSDKHFYLDDDEIGLHPITSHPNFRKHFTDEFYYDCCDEEAPFGSDEGSDALYIISEILRKKPEFKFVDFPKYIIEKEWDMKYISVNSLDENEVKKRLDEDEMNVIQSDMITFACAFAQIKITGLLDSVLKNNAIDAMKRIKIAAKHLDLETTSQIQDKMIKDLSSFAV